jgi:glycosyltransferase involved in cell wall biosynthesis
MGHLALFNILSDPRVSEIVVLDDGSLEENFNRIKKRLAPFFKKVKLYRRKENWGAFANKIQVVDLCSSDWVVLLDYDNTIGSEYLDAMFGIESWENDTIYCPDFAYPSFDFRDDLSGKSIDLDSASAMAKFEELNTAFFNDGNYLLSRESYLATMKPFIGMSVSAADVIFANYLWLSRGNRLEIVPNSRYVHRVHEGSTWLTNHEKSMKVLRPIVERIADRACPDSECLKAEFREIARAWVEPEIVS